MQYEDTYRLAYLRGPEESSSRLPGTAAEPAWGAGETRMGTAIDDAVVEPVDSAARTALLASRARRP
jgi:hypothetical protein